MANRILRKTSRIVCLIAVVGLLLPTAVFSEDIQDESPGEDSIQQSYSSPEIYPVYVDGERVVFDNDPIVDNQNILVEFRKIFELLGYVVGWDASTKTAYGIRQDQRVEFPVDQSFAIVNGEVKEIPVHTRIVNGRTMIPLRFISEESGYEVIWDSGEKAVFIYSGQEAPDKLSPVSNVALNGYVALEGPVDELVKLVRIDISHTDTVNQTHTLFLEPMNGLIDAIFKLPYGPGMYTVQIFTSEDDDRYGTFDLQDTFKIAYPEDEDLIVVPHDDDPHRYTIKMRLSPEAEQAVLKIAKLDREAYMNISLADAGSAQLIEEEVYLAFGSGVYEVTLFELNDGNQLIKTATLTHEGEAGIALEDDRTENSQLRVKGTVSPDMQWMWVQYANTSSSLIRNAFVPVVDGKIDHVLHLNMGEGLYQIKIEFGHHAPYNSGYATMETFQVENLDTRDRYLLPSETVQSDDESIIELASQITEGIETDREKSLAIHDWVATNISLDTAQFFADDEVEETALAVVVDRVSSGKGMARLNAALHRAAGIPAKVISGEVLIGDELWVAHAWNEIYVEDRWMIQDTARNAGKWDLEEGSFQPSLTHKYFDPAIEKFTEDHKKLMDMTE